MEFIIFSDDTVQAGPAEIEWKLSRPTFNQNSQLLHNYGSNNVYYNMYFRTKKTQEANISLTPEGVVTAKTVVAKNAPTGATHVTNKQYVDDAIATKTSVTIGGAHQKTFDADTKANKKYVDDNFVSKTGDTITGDLKIVGNLQVQGTTETVDAVTYKIENNVIEFNPDKINNETWLTGLAINKGRDGETDLGTYGIMYDPSTDAVKLGFGQVDEENKFKFNINESAPIATREEFDDSWEEDEIFVFDKETKKFKHSGKTFTSFEEEITAKILTKMRSEMNTFVKDYVENYMSYTEIEHEDGTIDTISDILFVENYTEKQNGTELWVEEN
jgi:hypothetical protein